MTKATKARGSIILVMTSFGGGAIVHDERSSIYR